MFPLLKSFVATENEHIYFEGDEIAGIYFLMQGSCGFVLPKHKNAKYITIKPGSQFGIIDIVGCILQLEHDEQEDVLDKKSLLRRQFTVMSDTGSEQLMLSINDLNRMRNEFLENYEEMM